MPLAINVVPPLTTPAKSRMPPPANSVPVLLMVPLNVSVAPVSTSMTPAFARVLPLVACSTFVPLNAFTVAPLATLSAPLTWPLNRSICALALSTMPPLLTVTL